jgi:hypothetical protein
MGHLICQDAAVERLSEIRAAEARERMAKTSTNAA